METDLNIKPGISIPVWELWFTASRSSGPGGQHVNKTSSRITLHWAIHKTMALDERQRLRVTRRLRSRINREGILHVNADTARSQRANKDAARARLAELVRGALHVERRRVATRPTRGSKERRLGAKKQRGSIKRNRRKPGMDD